MSQSQDSLWRAYQQSQSRKFRDIEIADYVHGLDTGGLIEACRRAGLSFEGRHEAALRDALADLLRADLA